MILRLGSDVAVGAVDGGGGQGVVVLPNHNILPLLFCAGVVDVGEAGATVERTTSDVRHAVGNGDARQAGATVERTTFDARHAPVGGNRTILTAGNQRFALSFDQTVSVAVIYRISLLNHNIRQAGAIVERTTFDTRHAIGDGDARQDGATVERKLSDARHAVGDGDAREAGAIGERTMSDARHAVGDGDARQSGTTVERRVSDTRHAVRNDDARQSGATGEHKISDARHAVALGTLLGNHHIRIRTFTDAADIAGTVAI